MSIYLEAKKSGVLNPEPGQPKIKVKGFVLPFDNYSLLWSAVEGCRALVFIDSYNWVYFKRFELFEFILEIRDLNIGLTVLKGLPIGSFDTLIIDSTDSMVGDIVPLYEFCVCNNINLFFVLGVTQNKRFFRYNVFFQNTLDEVIEPC